MTGRRRCEALTLTAFGAVGCVTPPAVTAEGACRRGHPAVLDLCDAHGVALVSGDGLRTGCPVCDQPVTLLLVGAGDG